MADRPILVIHQMFADLPDPRVERTKRHALLDIITIAVCAVLSGADTWVDVEQWGHAKHDWLTTFLELPGGIPRTTPLDGCSPASIPPRSSAAFTPGSRPFSHRRPARWSPSMGRCCGARMTAGPAAPLSIW